MWLIQIINLPYLRCKADECYAFSLLSRSLKELIFKQILSL